MPSWEDFAFGRKRAGAIPPLPERLVAIAKKKIKAMFMQTRTISRMFLLVAILAPLSWSAVARAQDAAPAPAGPRSLAPTPFQLILGGATYRGATLASQQTLLDDRVASRIGRIAAGDAFLVSPYNYVFAQNGFDANPVGIFFTAPGMTAYPNATWGARVKVRPTARTYVMGGVYNGDPSIRANTHHGVDFSLHGPLFAVVEVGYQRNGLPGGTGLLGNYKAGLWYDHSRFPDFTTAGRGQAPHLTRGNWGFYGLFDQVLVRFGEPGSNRGFGAPGRSRH